MRAVGARTAPRRRARRSLTTSRARCRQTRPIRPLTDILEDYVELYEDRKRRRRAISRGRGPVAATWRRLQVRHWPRLCAPVVHLPAPLPAPQAIADDYVSHLGDAAPPRPDWGACDATRVGSTSRIPASPLPHTPSPSQAADGCPLWTTRPRSPCRWTPRGEATLAVTPAVQGSLARRLPADPRSSRTRA